MQHFIVVFTLYALLFGLSGCSDDAIDTTAGSEADAFVSAGSGADLGTGEPAVVPSLDSSVSPTPEDVGPSGVDPTESWSRSVDELVDSMGQFEPGEATNDGVTLGPKSAPVASGNFVCTTQSMSQTAQFTEYIASQVNSNSLWVGALVRGQALTTGMLTEAQLPRTPITVSISLDNLNGPSSVEIPDPSLSAYREAVRGLLSNGLSGSQPAQLTFNSETIHSEEHLTMHLGADVSAGSVDVAAAFDFSRSEVRSRVIVNFVQAYYTVDMDAFGRASEFFEPRTELPTIGAAFGGDEAEAPLYVSSITYGRRVIFTAESTASASELKAALDFAYNGIGANIDVNARMSHEEILNESNLQAFILGGNADDAVAAIDGLAGIQSYIAEGGTFSPDSPGAPIGYKLNHLSDNSAARLSLTTEYDRESCIRAKQNVKVTLKGITPRNGQNTAKTYGTILARSLDDSGNETMSHLLFDRDRDERISMDENQEWQPSNIGVSGILPAVASLEPGAEGARIHLKIRLVEFDNPPFAGERADDDAFADMNLTPADGWRQGCGNGEDLIVDAAGNRQSYDVRFCLQPMPD